LGIGKLGGVSTLTSLEALWSSGYQVDAIIFDEMGPGRTSDLGGERGCRAGVHDGGPFGGGEVKGGVGRGFAIYSRGGAFDVVRGGDGPMELLCLGGLPMRANEGGI
jgi:hypothetical protein